MEDEINGKKDEEGASVNKDVEIASLFNSRKTTKCKFTKIKNKLTTLLESDSPSRREVKLLANELKVTETKLEEICEKLQILLTSVGDTERLEQIVEWLDKVTEEALTARTEAARYLDVRDDDSSSSVSSKASFQVRRKDVLGARLKEPPKRLDLEYNASNARRTLLERPFEADFPSEKPWQSKPKYGEIRAEDSKFTPNPFGTDFPLNMENPLKSSPPYGEVRKDDSKKKSVVDWLDSTPDPEPNTNLWRHLEKIPLPKFSGDKTKYEEWKARFKACVESTNAPRMYKLVRLRSLLRGEAEDLLEGLGWGAPDYESAWRILEREYGGDARFLSHQFTIMRDLKQVRSTEDFVKFARKLNSCVTTLENRERFEDLGAGMLYSVVKTKLPEKMLQNYYGWLEDKYRPATLKSLCDWASQKARHSIAAEEDVKGINVLQQKKEGNDDRMKLRKKKHSFAARDEALKKNPPKCVKCKGNHELPNCREFQLCSLRSRWRIAQSKKLCFRCLLNDHRCENCAKKNGCKEPNCDSKYHHLLHYHKEEQKEEHSQAEEVTDVKHKEEQKGDTKTATTSYVKKFAPQKIALRTIPVTLVNGNKRIKGNAFLDDGSTATYIREDVANYLGLEGKIDHLKVTTLTGSTSLDTQRVNLYIESCDGNFGQVISAWTKQTVTPGMKVVDWNTFKKEWPHLRSIEFPEVYHDVVDILVGLDAIDLHNTIEEIWGKPGEPVARRTPLGWTCVGDPEKYIPSESSNYAQSFHVHASENLDQTLRRFWELDAIGIRSDNSEVYTPAEREAMAKVAASRRYVDGRYEVGIPWIQEERKLENNRVLAQKRLENLEKSLQRKPKVAEQYNEALASHLKKGYIRKLTPEESMDRPKWFLPHFPVIREDKATTKVRTVFDSAAKFKGRSLNDMMHSGPKLQNDLVDILVRFRSEPVALVGDICEMFMQVGLAEKDRPYHCILWRNFETYRPADVYEFMRLVFGDKASPYLAQDVCQEHARSHSEEYPEAAKTVLESMYIDDVMDSVSSIEKAIGLRRDITELLGLAGMRIRKWCSNEPDVLQDIPEEDRAGEIHLEDGKLPTIKTLGVLWKSKEDVFTFQLVAPPCDTHLTKRIVISLMSKIFDPLQILAPYTIRAKILMQQSWLRGIGWDDPLPMDLVESWKHWFEHLPDLASLELPRCYSKKGKTVMEQTIHTFVDASEQAYAAVSYLRQEYTNGEVSVIFVAAKPRVAPLKVITIPRLELVAAVIGVRLSNFVGRSLNISVKEHVFWSDSQNVICWLRNESRRFKPFVANRVGEIHESVSPAQWRHVPGKQNPADKATRGLTAEELLRDPEWIFGPPFLYNDPSKWPEQKIEDPKEAKEEEKATQKTCATTVGETSSLVKIMSFSKWLKLARTVAWCLRFLSNIRCGKDNRQSGELEPQELKKAERVLVCLAQEESFPNELKALRNGRGVPSSSPIKSLNPILDADGLLRVNGRLKLAANLSEDAKTPILLPKKHHITKLIIAYYHELKNHEAGVNHILADIRTRFWIVHGREAVRAWEFQCNQCKKRKAKPAEQIMAPLPKCRLGTPMRAFARCGVDYGGPYITKQGRGKSKLKRYLCLFTCTTTRAVHLEMAWSLDTDSFLKAFSRMTDRRGLPIEVISDNGTNFVSGERELRELVALMDQDKIKHSMSNKGIKWHFNPPRATHFGGFFEAMIKSAKRAIAAVLGEADISDEELLTAITGAEGILNSRPLTYQSADPKDEPVLTPNHFLYGQASGQLAPQVVDEIDFHPRRRWLRVQQLIKEFWQRWLREFLPMLNTRKKWTKEKKDLTIGEVVLCLEPGLPRGKWPLGRVEQIHVGPDGHVRVARVRIGDNVYTRPVTKLCPLEFGSEEMNSEDRADECGKR